MLLRIDDTDAARNIPGGEEALRDLEWLGVAWDEGPVRQSERQDATARRPSGWRRPVRPDHAFREDGTATYHLASVVDDIEFGITHVVRGNDHRPNEGSTAGCTRRSEEAPRVRPPRADPRGGRQKLSKRAEGATVASLREAGIPAEAVRRYLDELGIPRHDVHYDLPRIRRLASRRSGDGRRGARRAGRGPAEVVPGVRGARDLVEARDYAQQVLERPPPATPRGRHSSASGSCATAPRAASCAS